MTHPTKKPPSPRDVATILVSEWEPGHVHGVRVVTSAHLHDLIARIARAIAAERRTPGAPPQSARLDATPGNNR